MSLLPENLFFLTELLFQMRALVGKTAFFTLFHECFITARLRSSNCGEVEGCGMYTAGNIQWKGQRQEEASPCFFPSFFFSFQCLFHAIKGQEILKWETLRWVSFLAFKQEHISCPGVFYTPKHFFDISSCWVKIVTSWSIDHCSIIEREGHRVLGGPWSMPTCCVSSACASKNRMFVHYTQFFLCLC